MSEKVRYLISEGGVDNGAAWMTAGQNILVPAQTQLSTTTTFEQMVWQVPYNNLYDYYGAKNASPLASDLDINALWQAWITFNLAYTAVAGAGLTLRQYRAGALVTNTSADIAGWATTTTTGGVPTTAALTPLAMPWVIANTALQAPANQTISATVAFLQLQPGDVLTLLYNNQSSGNWTPPTINLQLDLT